MNIEKVLLENTSSLTTWLLTETKELMKQFEYGDKKYAHIDNGGSVLAVVHLDTVVDHYFKGGNNFDWHYTSTGDIEVNSISLDDRLGAWIVMDILPKLGIKVDVLLTTDEEIGRSTAMGFYTSKNYNWMFQFDRHGYGNVVMYEFETMELISILETHGYEVEIGTFSDICYLTDLGVAGFNFGVGYKNEHTHQCHTRFSWIELCVRMFQEFYIDNSDKKFEYEYVPPKKTKYSGMYDGRKWAGMGWEDDYDYYPMTVSKKGKEDKGSAYGAHCDNCGDYYFAEDLCSYRLEELGEMILCEKCLAIYMDGKQCSQCGIHFADEDFVSQDPLVCYDCAFDAYNEKEK